MPARQPRTIETFVFNLPSPLTRPGTRLIIDGLVKIIGNDEYTAVPGVSPSGEQAGLSLMSQWAIYGGTKPIVQDTRTMSTDGLPPKNNHAQNSFHRFSR